MKKIISLVIVLIMIMLLFVGCGSESNNSNGSIEVKTESTPTEVAEKYFDAVKHGDVDTAISCFTPNIQAEWKAVMSLTNFFTSKTINFSDASTLLGGLIATANTSEYKNYTFTVTDEEIVDDSAKVIVSIKSGEKDNGTTTINFAKVYNQWYITENAPTEESIKSVCETTFSKDDGPVFLVQNSNQLSVHQICIDNVADKEIALFTLPNNYETAIPLNISHLKCYAISQLFDKDFTKLAVSWKDIGTNSSHVGWIDRNGDVVDITNAIYGDPNGFSKVPQNGNALFAPDGTFFFVDKEKKTYNFVNTETKHIIKIEEPIKGNYGYEELCNIFFDVTSNVHAQDLTDGFVCLHFSDELSFLSNPSKRYLIDFVGQSAGLWIDNKCIGIMGKGYTNKKPISGLKYEAYDYEDEKEFIITPETDYIFRFATYNEKCNKIAFVACRGEDNSLFVVDAKENATPQKIYNVPIKYQMINW